MIGIHINVISESEMEQFLREKVEARGNITKFTLTSGEAFIAKNLPIYGQKGTLI